LSINNNKNLSIDKKRLENYNIMTPKEEHFFCSRSIHQFEQLTGIKMNISLIYIYDHVNNLLLIKE